MQDKFSWKSVGLAAVAGGVGAGLAGQTLIKGAGAVVNGAARGVASNLVTQGVSVATGLQKRFDWTGVAVGGVVGGTAALLNGVPGLAPTELR